MAEKRDANKPGASVTGDLDEDYKLLASAALMRMGFVTEIAVPIDVDDYRFTYRHQQATDADVFARRFSSDLSRESVVVECKSGEKGSVEELLKLGGAIEVFGADRGWLVKTKIAENARLVARTLNVKPFNQAEISGFVMGFGLDPDAVVTAERELLRAHTSLRSKLKGDENLGVLIKYCEAHYWRRPHWQNFQNLIALLAVSKEHLDSTNSPHRALVFDAVRLAGESIIQLTSEVADWARDGSDRGVELFLFGGPTQRRERERLFDELRMIAPDRFSGHPLDPPYLDSLKEVVSAILRNSGAVPEVLPVLQETYRIEYLLSDSTPIATRSDVSLKLAKDIVEFVLQATGLSLDFADEFFAK